MFGLIDDLTDQRKEIKALKDKVHDLKVLVNLLLLNPYNESIKEAVRIALRDLDN